MVHPCRGFNQGTTAFTCFVNATCAERTLALTIGGGGQRDKQASPAESRPSSACRTASKPFAATHQSLFIRHFPQASSVWRQARSCRMATCAQVQHGIGAATWRPFFSDAPDISGFRRGRESALRGRRYRYGVLKPSVGGRSPDLQWRCRSSMAVPKFRPWRHGPRRDLGGHSFPTPDIRGSSA